MEPRFVKTRKAMKRATSFFFKESPDNIVTQGYFDNNWVLPAEASAAMKASGVMHVN